ncbi:unnamed protein product [Brassica napus]|uniref:(rape) hypothetical protein n=2 Tax=Brassica napus TaxID=3708 RepID=A0A816LLV3_BRANA|nr:unnamed protein product [Brassica napus]
MPSSPRLKLFHARTSPSTRRSTSLIVLTSLAIGLFGFIFGLAAIVFPSRTCLTNSPPKTVRVVWDVAGNSNGGNGLSGGVKRHKVMGFVGIQTGFGSAGRRRALRSTWMPSDPEGLRRLEESTGLAIRFIIGKTKDEKKMAELRSEIAEYDDFILLDIEEEYSKLPYKTLAFFKAAYALYDSEFYVKADDDIYLRPDRLSLLLAKERSHSQTYLGCLKKGPVFTDPKLKWYEPLADLLGKEYFLHAYGPIYALSADVVTSLVALKNNRQVAMPEKRGELILRLNGIRVYKTRADTMLKPIKHVSEPDTVADKLRRSLNMTNNKQDNVHVEFGSPITPLQTQPSGLTSAATTTSNSSFSSSSSGSVSGRAVHTPASTKSDSGRSNPSAVQSSRATAPSASQTSKTSNPSAAKSSKSTTSGSSNPAGAKAGSNPRPGRVSSASDSASGSTKRSTKSSTPPPQPVKILPGGNLFPSGKVHITGMTQGVPKRMILGPGSKSYGYGSVMRGTNSYSSTPAKLTTSSGSSSGALVISRCASGGGGSEVDTSWKRVMNSPNPEEVKRLGNEMFKKGCFSEALKFYDRALELSPSNATYRSNRAAALSGLGRIAEAVVECEHAIKLDPNFARAHHRLATLLLRLGQVDNAGKHFFYVEEPSDPMVVKVLEEVDRHLNKCAEARGRGEWNIVLTEVSAAMESGADMSPQLAMCKVEALMKLLRLDEAQTILASAPKIEILLPSSFTRIRFFDMISEAYTYFVKSQMELALGRFENAVTFIEKASEMEPRNGEIETLNRNVKMIVRARDRGNGLYGSERYTEASAAYAEGLKFDPYNATLFSHRADCFFKVGMWESSIEDCSHALLILPSCTKARRQRAASYSKLERWAEAVSDYEILRKELSYDREIAESLFHAQVALKKSRGEVVLNMEFGGEVEEVFSLEELKAALTRPGVSVVLFMKAFDQQCKEISIFMDALCIRYPSLHFLKVEIEKCPEVGDAEKVRVVPTFKIYKVGIRMKEIVCPSKEALEISVRHYGL